MSFKLNGLTKLAQNYSRDEKGFLDFVKTCEAFRVNLLGEPFLLSPAYKALSSIFNLELKASTGLVKRVMP